MHAPGAVRFGGHPGGRAGAGTGVILRYQPGVIRTGRAGPGPARGR